MPEGECDSDGNVLDELGTCGWLKMTLRGNEDADGI